MAETLTEGSTLVVGRGSDADTSRFAADALFALLAAEEETSGIGSSQSSLGRPKR